MPVPPATAHRVLAACLIAGGVVLVCACGFGWFLVISLSPLRGMGNPSAASQEAGHQVDVRSLWIASSIGLVGVAFVVGGLLRWPRKR